MARARRIAVTRRLFGAEPLERRDLLAVAAWQPPAAPAIFPLPPAAIVGQVATPALAVAVVPDVDPLYGYAFALTSSAPARGFDFAAAGRLVTAAVDVGLVDVPLGATLDLEVLSGLQFWNGRGQPAFAAVTGGVEINLRAAGADLRIGRRTDQAPGQPAGSIRHTLGVAVSDGLPVARRIQATIGSGGVGESFAKPGAPSGIYAFSGLWSVRNAAGIRDSVPVTLVFAVGSVSRQVRDAAVAAVSTPAARPAAIVAVATEVVRPSPSGEPFLRINVQYSSPVTVSGRAPRLPVIFDRSLRFAELEGGSARTGVTSLSFSVTPTPGERAAGVVRIGDALRPQSGGTIRATAGGAAILSLPPEAARDRVIGFEAPLSIVSADIVRATTFRRGTTYVIDGEVHVRPGVALTIEDGVTVLIRNGYRPRRTITTSALIFDSGSRLNAATVTFASADSQNRQTSEANNGGVFFLGTTRSCSKDGISVDTAATRGRSSFTADLVVLKALGRADPLGNGRDRDDRDRDDRDDIDAISLLGLGGNEWRIREVRSENSGDDGFDATNSSVVLDRLTVVNPAEDGLNISSSLVRIRQALTVVMSPNIAPDRQLFDLEVDDGPARIVISRDAAVDLRGFWGSVYDEVDLDSLDMPAPPRRGKTGVWYVFAGVLRRGPAIVYSTIAD